MVLDAHPVPRGAAPDDRVTQLRLVHCAPRGQHEARPVLCARHRGLEGLDRAAVGEQGIALAISSPTRRPRLVVAGAIARSSACGAITVLGQGQGLSLAARLYICAD